MACGEHAPNRPHGEGLAHQLLSRAEVRWQTHETPHAHLHFEPGSYTAKTAVTLAADVEQARAEALSFLQQRDTGPPSELFFVDSREAMARLIGQPIAGMVKSGEKTALFVRNAGYRPFLMHELTHFTRTTTGVRRGADGGSARGLRRSQRGRVMGTAWMHWLPA